jgi:hypothetical protein
VRTVNSANELAHYEYGANLASTAILTALECHRAGKNGKTESARCWRQKASPTAW